MLAFLNEHHQVIELLITEPGIQSSFSTDMTQQVHLKSESQDQLSTHRYQTPPEEYTPDRMTDNNKTPNEAEGCVSKGQKVINLPFEIDSKIMDSLDQVNKKLGHVLGDLKNDFKYPKAPIKRII